MSETGFEMTEPQEGTLALIQHLVGLSGMRLDRQTGDGKVHATILPVDIGQSFNVRPFGITVDHRGVPEVPVADGPES